MNKCFRQSSHRCMRHRATKLGIAQTATEKMHLNLTPETGPDIVGCKWDFSQNVCAILGQLDVAGCAHV